MEDEAEYQIEGSKRIPIIPDRENITPNKSPKRLKTGGFFSSDAERLMAIQALLDEESHAARNVYDAFDAALKPTK